MCYPRMDVNSQMDTGLPTRLLFANFVPDGPSSIGSRSTDVGVNVVKCVRQLWKCWLCPRTEPDERISAHRAEFGSAFHQARCEGGNSDIGPKLKFAKSMGRSFIDRAIWDRSDQLRYDRIRIRTACPRRSQNEGS